MNKFRILHTSDWHIGQRLHGKDRHQEHEYFFQWLLRTLTEQHIDLLIIAGDIFDVGYPSNQALKQYYNFLSRCNATCSTQIVITGGNHDYISTLNAPKPLLESLNITVIGGASADYTKELIPIEKDNKLLGYVCAIPYLRDKDIRQSVAGENYDDRIKATRNGIAEYYKRIADYAQTSNINNLPVIATGHLYMAGASTSESEREIQMGNEAAFKWDAFPQTFDYVALGHIHRPQKVAQQEHVRYSGSPIPLSFSERKDTKQVVLVEFDTEKQISIQSIEVPIERKLISFSGTLAEVKEAIKVHKSANQLTDWAETRVTEPQYDPILIAEYKELLEESFDVEIVKPSISFTDRIKGVSALYEEQPALSDLTNTEVFEKLLERSNFDQTEELMGSYKELVQSVFDKEQ
ncbi:exonuclease subunit SbcD [Prolixibacteraceae bacterium JC049]|nr:exonuclease subunit SbcD [Prolixibacteraceae bacterium JC049]